MRDTIAALASGAGRAGVAVIRISGPGAEAALAALTRKAAPPPRSAARRRFRSPADGEVLDEGLALWFPAPASFTGEDMAELHVHGGPAVVAAVLEALTALPATRLARPGEFTRRAFEQGKLDLTQAEALADLVEAETEGQRRQAQRQAAGALSALYDGWRAAMLECLGLLEAAIDFPDEELPADLAERTSPKLAALEQALRRHLDDGRAGERVREGFCVAILGAPNAGKSSLLNALARREAAIVSSVPGTTRDVVEARVVLAGCPVWLADTAGLREAVDPVEAEGVRRALARADDADLRIWVCDPFAPAPPPAGLMQPGDLGFLSKADLAPDDAALARARAGCPALDWVTGAATQGEAGLRPLALALEERIAAALDRLETAPITRVRHRRLVSEAAEAVTRARQAVAHGAELAAEDLRAAAQALAVLTGRIDVEEVLAEIFSTFCIGK